MTATGVTPDIVLENFLMLWFPYSQVYQNVIMATNREIFDEIAKSWYGYRHWSRFTRELEQVAAVWREGRLLNIGCAHGPDFLPFKERFDLHGVDISAQMVMLARKYAMKFDFKVDLVVADAVCLPYRDGIFDYAIAIASYHHISGKERRARAFRELHRVLKPGGEAFITVWNKWQRRFLWGGKEVYVPWKSKSSTVDRYYYLFEYYELKKYLKEAGFKVIEKSPVISNIYTKRLFSQNIQVLIRAD
jgi:tRNA (uracil-5-)-methyltransferase TRM9